MIDEYLEKVYSGFLGMNIGIRLGAPVEPTIWTYERIKRTYGDIRNYVKEYKNFAADDDVNGPVFFLRALNDEGTDHELTPQDVARAWLNYTREGIGMFWWGGYGISTEHTAYLNLKQGIEAPKSGSAEQNGLILSEQIGGQIFIDTWGLVLPGQPERAALFGRAAASVSHDGEGIYGAEFLCACISEAFITNDIMKIILKGLSIIPEDSIYAKVANAVITHYNNNPSDWRSCYHMLEADFGYDKYGGVCHIIPNAGVCILAMLYGEGRFDRTVEIATMCGWDTDCNAGNVGTVLGVMNGIEGLPDHYRRPINDGLVLSGISGYLNILDIPTYAKEVALFGYKLLKETPPENLSDTERHEISFDFELPGSTHNIRLSNSFFCTAKHSTERAHSGSGSLQILVDRMSRGQKCKMFYKPFYMREEFSDERYSPVFSPTVMSGQTVSMFIYLEQWNGWETLGFAPYIRTAFDKKEYLQGYRQFKESEWMEISFEIPDTQGAVIDEVGLIIEGYAPAKSRTLGVLYLDDFKIYGKREFSIDIAKQAKEYGSVTPFSLNHGAVDIEGDRLSHMRCGDSFAYTGAYYASDYEVSAIVNPQSGDSHLMLLRAQGAMRGYAAGLEGGKAVIYKNNFGFEIIAESEYLWENGRDYKLTARVTGNRITLFINDKPIAEAADDSFSYGMFGFGSLMMGRTLYSDFRYKDI